MDDCGLELIFTGTFPQRFTQPDEIFVARSQAEAWSILEHVESLQARGVAIAGFLSYELGYSCVRLAEPTRNAASRRLPYLLLGAYHPHAITPYHAKLAAGVFSTGPLQPRISRDAYDEALHAISRGLCAGDFYQINLTVPFEFTYSGDPAIGFAALQAQTQAPYSAYLRYEDTVLLSLSPELFLRFDGGRLTTKPMKGTASLDELEMLSSEKNRAEHVMIVDLLRNDLSVVCGDVRVDALFERELYPTFATMTSTISGRLKPDTPFHEIVRALFPCGSITGAPKRAAIARIGTLEPDARDAYCGAVGYLLPDGRGEWNVAIRTAQLDTAHQTGRLDLGGGIVADSQPDDEWRELEIKGRFFETAKFSPYDRV